MNSVEYSSLSKDDLIAILRERDAEERGGIRLSYTGKRPPWEIIRKVKPRRQKIVGELCVGSEDGQSNNLIVEGENLQAMVSLYKYRGQIDLIIADPPYNTGQDFRYNDKWDEDPNDPDLGSIVPSDDGSRHSKWLKFMTPRLWMMKEMLKPTGVIAVFIGDDELYRLGMLMDSIFGEKNRLGIINWQKIYKTKKQASHLAKATEYVLVYEKVTSASRLTSTVSASVRAIDKNIDNDPNGPWTPVDPTGKGWRAKTDYGLQSPIDGHIYYPGSKRHWAYEKTKIKQWVEGWGSEYVELQDPNARSKSLVLKGTVLDPKANRLATPPKILAEARKHAEEKRSNGVWPYLFFTDEGKGRPMLKLYKSKVERGEVPMTYWADDEFDRPLFLGSQSWRHAVAGTSKRGTMELANVLGDGVVFETVKPLEVIEKIIHLWCPRGGIVLDPFAGTGTTAHAVLELNETTEATRRFVLIEQGRPEKGDPFARALTAERVKRVITGEWANGQRDPVNGAFRFTQLTKAVDADAVLALEREEMIDLLVTSHWDQSQRAAGHLARVPIGESNLLFATNSRGEGYFLVWRGPDKPSVLDRATFRQIVNEAKAASLKPPYHVYSRVCTYSGPNIEFYQIPNRILEKLGFNEAVHPFNNETDNEEADGGDRSISVPA